MHKAVGALLIALGVGVGVLVALPYLKPLGTLLPSTRHMVETTKEILAQSRALQTGVRSVQTNLSQVERQEALLGEQEELMKTVLVELGRQQELGNRATDRLLGILQTEQTTAVITAKANDAGARTRQTVMDNASELGRLASASERIAVGSGAIDRQLDRLVTEMQGVSENFAVIGRFKAATGQVIDRAESWWNKFWRWVTRK